MDVARRSFVLLCVAVFLAECASLRINDPNRSKVPMKYASTPSYQPWGPPGEPEPALDVHHPPAQTVKGWQAITGHVEQTLEAESELDGVLPGEKRDVGYYFRAQVKPGTVVPRTINLDLHSRGRSKQILGVETVQQENGQVIREARAIERPNEPADGSFVPIGMPMSDRIERLQPGLVDTGGRYKPGWERYVDPTED
jgi:hypothetical protein